MNKICTKCNNELSESCFQFKNKKRGLRHSVCTECGKEYRRRHYANNVDYYVKKARRRNKAEIKHNQEQIVDYLMEHPCVDCGEPDPIVLQFDHVRGIKDDNVSSMVGQAQGWDTIIKEIAKCDVRCANCHIRKTAKQFNYRSKIKSS